MMPRFDDIPPGLQSLFAASGPILRFRILRDLCDQDDSWIRTAELSRELSKHPVVHSLLGSRATNGSWNGILCGLREDMFPQSTAFAMLKLCECGREALPQVRETIEKTLLPSLTREELLWEFTSVARSEAEKELARQLIRDACLRIIIRGTQTANDLIRAQLEIMLTEWKQYASGTGDAIPTLSGFSAVCRYPWDDEEFPRIRKLISAIFSKLESIAGENSSHPEWFEPHRLRLFSKEHYLANPSSLLYLLELSARLGITGAVPVMRWMLDELQIRQDADGVVRFEAASPAPVDLGWYFPLEAKHRKDYSIEYTFRALLIFKLLGYDF